MTFKRPHAPSKLAERLFLWAYVSAAISMLAYTIWAVSSGQLARDVFYTLWVPYCLGTSPIVLFAVAMRWHRRRKERALREFSKILRSLPTD